MYTVAPLVVLFTTTYTYAVYAATPLLVIVVLIPLFETGFEPAVADLILNVWSVGGGTTVTLTVPVAEPDRPANVFAETDRVHVPADNPLIVTK